VTVEHVRSDCQLRVASVCLLSSGNGGLNSDDDDDGADVDGGFAGTDGSKLLRFFSSTCYGSFDDGDEQGFYAVYRSVPTPFPRPAAATAAGSTCCGAFRGTRPAGVQAGVRPQSSSHSNWCPVPP
jgi:hypothetical protein